MDHMSCGLIHRPRLFEVFDSGQYYQIDGWYVLVDGKTKEMLDVLVMNQTQADERNKGLKEFGLSWSRTDSSVAAKIKPISRRKHQLSI